MIALVGRQLDHHLYAAAERGLVRGDERRHSRVPGCLLRRAPNYALLLGTTTR